jgi:hypothetical protein
MRTNTVVRPVHLDRGNVLRIVDGRGLRLTPASGIVWLTEQDSANDHVLAPGDTHALEQDGLALVLAHRPGRVMLEVPAGTPAPYRVEIAMSESGAGRRIVLRVARSLRLRAWRMAGGRAWRAFVAWWNAPRVHVQGAREAIEARFPYPYY